MRTETPSRTTDAPIRRLTRPSSDVSFRASPSQENVWILNQLQPGPGSEKLAQAVRLRGNLDRDRLESSLHEVVARHEALRTTFVAVDGVPRQMIAKAIAVPIEVVDLEVFSLSDQEAEARRLVQAANSDPFNLKLGPLIRVQLFRFSQEVHWVVLTAHPIVCDLWGLKIVLLDLARVYRAFRGDGKVLEPVTVHYADYSEWRRECVTPDVIEEQLRYWRTQLIDVPRVLELPTDFGRIGASKRLEGSIHFSLPADLLGRLRQRANELGTNLFVVLLASLHALLHRYSGQSTILIGAPSSGRTRKETERLVGCFDNLLPFKADFADDPRFVDLLAQVTQTVRNSTVNQEMPLARLRERLPSENDWELPYTLPRVALNLQPMAPDFPEVQGLIWEWTMEMAATARFDLSLSLAETAGELAGTWGYDAGLFEEATARQMLGHYRNLLLALADDPEKRVSELALLSDHERHLLLVEWNDTHQSYPKDRLFHELFEAQVERTPEKIAVAFCDQSLTYAALNASSNQVAHHLRTLGMGPDMRVALCVERNLDMMVGLLAVLKAGAAYVPMDPAYPKDRLAFMMEDSQAQILLTQKKLLSKLPPHQARVICLDEFAPSGPSANPGRISTPENLAYVIYTSGSTGQPKGAMIPHRGLVNYLTWAVEAYKVAEGEGAPVHSSISFDLTITGLLTPLLVGRAVHLLPEAEGLEGLGLALSHRQNFSLVKITPAHLEMLTHELPPTQIAGRTRTFVIGGEALLGENVAFWQERAPETVLVNEYGPTETVVGCCVYYVPRDRRFSGAIPIGRPIANTQLFVLDAHLQPVPVGVAGELYIAGDCVGRGYLNRPELTAARFIQNPFYEISTSSTLYKTGDRVRYLRDGNLEFLGRIDHQVKLRGFRIELGEIEAALSEHPDVQQCAVAIMELQSADKCLTAYVVFREDSAQPPAVLRSFLRKKLPEHMIPAAFVPMSALPLTLNGKVNRKTLPVPNRDVILNSQSVAPRTHLEHQLKAIWSELLCQPNIGVEDDFFDLGGNSLMAIRLVAAINRTFQKKLDIANLVACPTIAKIAKMLQAGTSIPTGQMLIPLRPGTDGPPVFLVWLNAPWTALRLPPKESLSPFLISEVPYAAELLLASACGKTEFFPSVAEMAAPHARLIRESGCSECFLGGFSYGSILAFEVAHQLRQVGVKVRGLFLFDGNVSPRGWEGVKQFTKRHSHRLAQEGFNYFGRTLKMRLNRFQSRNRIVSLGNPSLQELETANPEERWPFIDRIWIHALKRFRPQRLAARGILIKADDEPHPVDEDFDGCLGWSKLFAHGLKVVHVKGNHFSMWEEPYGSALRQAVDQSLQALQPRHPAPQPMSRS